MAPSPPKELVSIAPARQRPVPSPAPASNASKPTFALFWRPGLRPGEAALDAWSFAHVASGMALALAGLSWGWALTIIVGFEVLEAGLRQVRTFQGGLFEYESWPNIAADIATGALGFAIIKAL